MRADDAVLHLDEGETEGRRVGGGGSIRAASSMVHPPLESITRPMLDTAAAAYYLNRRPQTLRIWACFENGPIRPLRLNGRLAWSVSEIKKLLGVG